MRWLDKIPLALIAVIAAFMTFAPFTPEPHLWEKLKMLQAGTLIRPIDIFDLFWHGIWPILLVLKLVRVARQRSGRPD
jgi:hypothetical protein